MPIPGITNGGGGRIYGFEAAAQLQLEPWTEHLGLPGWMGGFGVSANLTLNNSEVTKPRVLDPAIAVTPAPARCGCRALRTWFTISVPITRNTACRCACNISAAAPGWMASPMTLTDGGDTYWAADDELDFSARYAINKNFEIYFDATNLLNKPGRRYSEPGNLLTATGTPTPFTDVQTIEWERFGRRFTGGVRFNF